MPSFDFHCFFFLVKDFQWNKQKCCFSTEKKTKKHKAPFPRLRSTVATFLELIINTFLNREELFCFSFLLSLRCSMKLSQIFWAVSKFRHIEKLQVLMVKGLTIEKVTNHIIKRDMFDDSGRTCFLLEKLYHVSFRWEWNKIVERWKPS